MFSKADPNFLNGGSMTNFLALQGEGEAIILQKYSYKF
jgi:hypothetical protein